MDGTGGYRGFWVDAAFIGEYVVWFFCGLLGRVGRVWGIWVDY